MVLINKNRNLDYKKINETKIKNDEKLLFLKNINEKNKYLETKIKYIDNKIKENKKNKINKIKDLQLILEKKKNYFIYVEKKIKEINNSITYYNNMINILIENDTKDLEKIKEKYLKEFNKRINLKNFTIKKINQEEENIDNEIFICNLLKNKLLNEKLKLEELNVIKINKIISETNDLEIKKYRILSNLLLQ